MSNFPETTFKLNQKIVYPIQGVGHIQSIEERKFGPDKTFLYYIIYLEVSDMTVMIPVNKAEEIGIRAIVSPEEAEKALEIIGDENEAAPTDWKMRYAMNQELLKKGAVTDTALVVRTLYHRSKLKELPIMERKLFDSAKKLLIDEVCLSLGKQKSEVEKLIHGKLEAESNRPTVESRSKLDDNDFDDDFDDVGEEEEEEAETKVVDDDEERETSLEGLAEEELANDEDEDEE
ncbi:MAG: CarD family transcriptional regulator [Spirochaetales bacterium]|nr:CarD family transcriptional regulator [Spirochaetales bacterium]